MNQETVKQPLIPNGENIQNKIFVCRGIQVMLDSDVAIFFGTETKYINKAVKRNANRFPNDFCFQLNSNEFKNLRFQNVTSNSNYGGRRYNPYVFTEHGIVALAGVLKSDIADKMSIEVTRAFIQMRHFILENGDVLLKLAQLQNRQINFEIETNKRFDEVIKLINKSELPKQVLFFDGQYYDAHDFICSLIQKAHSSIMLIDPYCDNRALSFLSNRKEGTQITICKSTNAKLSNDDLSSFAKQYGEITVIANDTIHDRFLILDCNECYSLGTSLNYAGRKTFVITKIEDAHIINSIIQAAINQK
ncbi:ORF6N domain-containing protein [Pseudobutyrivibrio sp.]